MNISKEAIEAAARLAFPQCWEEVEWRNAWHEESYRAHMKWAQEKAIDRTRAALEAVAPLLMAQAWDEGRAHGAMWPYGHRGLGADDNPYRKETP